MDGDIDDPKLPSKCKFCGISFSTRKDCIEHEKTCDKFIVIPQVSSSSSSARKAAPPSTNNKITCKYCSKQFTLRKNCLRHERTCGPCGTGESDSSKFTCELCGSTTNRKDNHKAHIKKCKERHSVSTSEENCQEQMTSEPSKEDTGGEKRQEQIATEPSKKDKKFLRSKTPCLFANCDEEFYHKTSLIEHLKNSHENVNVLDPISKKFNSINEFYQWKDEEQERTFSYFSQKSGQNASKTKYFYCQHDGISHSQRKTSRLNFKGRVKVGHYCIAKMIVWKDTEGMIHVLYYPTQSHVCLASDFVHHPLSKKDDLYINEKIAWGVSPSKILRDVQKKGIPRTSSPQDIQNCKASIITKKRIRERARKRKERRRYHKDEAKAVYLMVNKLRDEDDCVVLYKPYGDDVHIGPKQINLLPDHKSLFMIGLQTKRQAQLLADHCQKVVLVDETHGTNHHKFQLLSLMIVDDNRRGWPVGHLIMSKSDAETLKFFFQGIKQNSPGGLDLNINCVISDDDPALINAMDLGFEGSLGELCHILCKWHLLRAFKKNLQKYVPRNMVDEMMIELRVLVNEKDQIVFSNLQAGFIAKYQKLSQCKSFIDYYCKHYQNRAEKWAMCFRTYPHANINTTGHIESFHHRLKKSYLKRKVNRRIDDLLSILLDIEWDDHVTRVREATIGMAFQPQEILMRHRRGVVLPDEVLTKVDESTWDIKASSGNDVYYIVQYSEVCLSDHCFSKCSQIACGGLLCAHMYSCSCKDNNPLCKHVHKLHSFLTRDLVKQVRDNDNCGDSAIDDFPFNEEKKSIIPQATVNESEQRRTLSKNIQELEDNLSQLSQFYLSSKDMRSSIAVSNAIAHATSVTKELVLQLQYMAGDADVEDVAEMEPTIRFNSNEKLKTQASQVISFKKPSAKRKKKVEGVSPSKKQAVVKDLLSVLNGSNSSLTLTPPVSYVSNPRDIILTCRNEKISLMNLKSLEHQLTEKELENFKKLDPAFEVGWLYSTIINAYLDVLEEKYPSVLSVPSELALRSSRGFSNSNFLKKKFEDPQKDLLLLPINLSGSHWSIIAVLFDLKPAQMWYYDPMQNKLSEAMENMLFQLCSDFKFIFPSKSNWDSVVYVQSVKQSDSYNCGAHICAFAEQMSRKSRPYRFNDDIVAYRKEIYYSIVGNCLKRENFESEQCLVCGVNYLDSSNDETIWIACTKCEQWFHKSCVPDVDYNDFVCPAL